jgi:hypothetical protein
MIFVLFVLVVAWLIIRTRQQSTSAKPNPVRPASMESSEYHAVSIKFKDKACDAAKAMAGQRFLSAEAPILPLPECDVAECNCHFSHYKDRRARNDRRSPFASSISMDTTGRFTVEQRERKDRRHDDDIEDDDIKF